MHHEPFVTAATQPRPVGPSGAKILVHLLHALRNRGSEKGIASPCIGGGEAAVMGIEIEN